MALLQLKAVTLSFGGPPLLDAVDLTVDAGERIALLGRNGSGKSTLLRVLHGSIEPDAGRIIKDAGTRVALLDQRVPEGIRGTVEDLVVAGEGCLPKRPTEVHRAQAALSRAGLDATARFEDLSAGLKRRTLIASALASEAEVLLLDEPTNHLDLEAIDWLEGLLRRQEKTLVFVTHDRAFLRALATAIVDLDRGRLLRHGPDYDAFMARKRSALETEAKERALFDKKHAQEEAWIRQGVRERRKRNQGRVGRLESMRDARAARRERQGTARMEASAADPSGRRIVETKGLTYAWDEGPVVQDLDLHIQRGDRIGIVGPNGSGKTTLIRLLLGELEPDAGTVRQGTNLEVAYFDQLHAALDDGKTAAENVGDGSTTVMVNGHARQVISYLGDFLFTADQARSPITKLSGGERNRLLLARLFARPSNVLVLDEPTNDLDVETLEVLEDLLESYGGTVLMVSHDREMLDAVVDRLLVVDGRGGVREVEGGWSDWEAQRAREAAAKKAAAPRKAKPGKKTEKATSPLDKEERKALRELPARIEALETKLAGMHEAMSDPAFFQKPGEEIARAQAALKALEGEIGEAYERWEALEAKREGS